MLVINEINYGFKPGWFIDYTLPLIRFALRFNIGGIIVF